MTTTPQIISEIAPHGAAKLRVFAEKATSAGFPYRGFWYRHCAYLLENTDLPSIAARLADATAVSLTVGLDRDINQDEPHYAAAYCRATWPATDPIYRRPSRAQGALLVELAYAGRNARRSDLNTTHGVATWVALESRGYIIVDRGTPDNRGGRPADYLHTITTAGYVALAYHFEATRTLIGR